MVKIAPGWRATIILSVLCCQLAESAFQFRLPRFDFTRKPSGPKVDDILTKADK